MSLPTVFARLKNLRLVEEPPVRVVGCAFLGLLNLPLTWMA
jgi:hypothetical protein